MHWPNAWVLLFNAECRGNEGPTCASIIEQSSCTNTASDASGTPISCQWNQPSTNAADQTECQHTYLFSGMEVSMEAPDLDNFGRDGVELRKKAKGEMHGQFGVCNTPGYKLQQVFRHWLMLLLGFVASAFLLYVVIVAVVRSLRPAGAFTVNQSRSLFETQRMRQPARPTAQAPSQSRTERRYAFQSD